MSDRLLTIKDTAAYLKIHWQTVRTYIAQGKLKATKVGRVVRIRESDINTFLSQKEARTPLNEVELRFLTPNRLQVEAILLQLGAHVIYHGHVIDHWFVPSSIKNIDQKDEWFDNGVGFGLRIREQDNGYTGKMTTTLEIKRLVTPYKHDTCIEQEIDIPDYESALRLLNLMNLREMTTLDKDRLVYKYGECKVVIDDIKDFKTGVELEMMTDKDSDIIVPKLKAIAKKLKLDLDHELTSKSVTYLYMLENSRFD